MGDFEIQTDRSIPVRRPDLILIRNNKENETHKFYETFKYKQIVRSQSEDQT